MTCLQSRYGWWCVFEGLGLFGGEEYLSGSRIRWARGVLTANHYLHSVPSGKSHYLRFRDALVVWSIPANNNLSGFLLGADGGNIWELSRLWAPDGHARNLLTQAIAYAVRSIKELERPDLLVSYADPNAGHLGWVYRAASWVYTGRSEEGRGYLMADGRWATRRSFHSGAVSMTRQQITDAGAVELRVKGKHRYVFPISRAAKRIYTRD